MIIPEVWYKFKKLAWFLPGFFLYAAFPPVMEIMDVLFALAPLIYLSRLGDVRKSTVAWAQSGILFWVATLSWMPAIMKNGGPWPLVLLGWFALSAYCTLYFAAYGYLSAAYWRWVRSSTSESCLLRLFGILIVEPVLWCGLELIRSRFGGGFAWNQLGVVPANSGFGAPAAIGGVYLLSAIVILINGSIAGIVERMIRRGKISRWRSLETILVFAVVFAAYKSSVLWTAHADSASLKVALVQRNFPCCFKSADENPWVAYSNLVVNVGFMKPDLVVLPESAMSEFGLIESQRAERFAARLRRLTGAKAVVAGGTRAEGRKGPIFNSAAIYESKRREIYDKVHLVPFGEYIPGDKTLTWLQNLAPVGSCWPGEPSLLHLHLAPTPTSTPTAIPFATAICYEDTDSALVREFAAKGARFLCFITNDSWFSYSNEALAHAWQATARAIETGLTVVRVGNSGVTGTITPDGKWTRLNDADGKALVDKAGVMMDRICLSTPTPTPYTSIGDYPLAILFTLLIVAMILVKYLDKLRRERLLK